jgi:hypothetical protein
MASVCASADLFHVSGCSKATVSPPKSGYLFKQIERDVQLCHNCLDVISDDDQFDIDPFV